MENEEQAALFSDPHLWQRPEPPADKPVGGRKARVEPIGCPMIDGLI